MDSGTKAEVLNEKELPARDNFGQVVDYRVNQTLVIGSNLLTTESDEKDLKNRQIPYSSEFRPLNLTHSTTATITKESFNSNNILVAYLTVKGQSKPSDYFDAFEETYHNQFSTKEIDSHKFPLSQLKRWSLNYLDYMGILDYEYSTREIIVDPPQFILIPSQFGRKVLLIGGRTPDLIEKISTEVNKRTGLYLSIESQHESLTHFLLPQTITIIGHNERSENTIENKIKEIANACTIAFEPDKFTQIWLARYSGTITDYSDQLIADQRFNDSGWTAKVFDPEKLSFISDDPENIDKSFSLVEYKLNEYTYKHRLWKEGLSFEINKNWGRYLTVNNIARNVIYFDRDKKVIAIPASLPLPRLINEAMTLCSGKAPKNMLLDIDGVKTYFNLYENIPSTFAWNSFRKIGQKPKEIKITI